MKPFLEPLSHGMSGAQDSGPSIQPGSQRKSGTAEVGSGSISKRKQRPKLFHSEFYSADSDSELEIFEGATDITGGIAAHVEASLQTISAPTASEQTGDSSEQIGLQPPAADKNITKGARFVPPRSTVAELSDEDDAFMPDVHKKHGITNKGKGVVRKATGHDDSDTGLSSQAVPAEKRQSRGCHSLYKSANFDEDQEEPAAPARPAGRGRGVGRGSGRGIGRGVGSTKVQ